MDSALLAQLAADKKHSRLTAPQAWYHSYTNTLGNLAWQVAGFRSQQYLPPGEMFTLEEIVLDALRETITKSEVDIVHELIRTFNELPEDDPRVLVYERFSRSSYLIDLQVGVTNGSSMLSSVGVVLETKHEIVGFREEVPVSQLVGEIRTLLYKGTLNEQAYSALRKDVIAKLGAKRHELILDLDLS